MMGMPRGTPMLQHLASTDCRASRRRPLCDAISEECGHGCAPFLSADGRGLKAQNLEAIASDGELRPPKGASRLAVLC